MRILVVKLSSLGDLFHALPAVHALKTGLNAQIDWVVQAEYAGLARCFDDVAEVIPFDRRHFARGIVDLRKDLAGRAYDLVIDLQGLLKSAVVARLACAPRRIGPSYHREGSRLLYTEVAGRLDKLRHAVDENMDVVRYLGLPDGEKRFGVTFPPVAEAAGARPRIALLPVSRWPSKNWPARCFADTAARIHGALGTGSFHILGGGGDTAVCAELAAVLPGEVFNHAGRASLVETGSRLTDMDLLIANDSGPVHMAAAVGTPTLVVFGPTDPARTGPYGSIHRVVQAALPCQPCFSRSCRCGGVPCLASVTPEEVAEVALQMLGKRGVALSA